MHFSPCSSQTLVAQENGDNKTKPSDSWSRQRSLSRPGSRRASHLCVSFEVFSLGGRATLYLFLRKAWMVIAPAELHGVGFSEWASVRSLERFLTHRGPYLLAVVVRAHRPWTWAWSHSPLLVCWPWSLLSRTLAVSVADAEWEGDQDWKTSLMKGTRAWPRRAGEGGAGEKEDEGTETKDGGDETTRKNVFSKILRN